MIDNFGVYRTEDRSLPVGFIVVGMAVAGLFGALISFLRWR